MTSMVKNNDKKFSISSVMDIFAQLDQSQQREIAKHIYGLISTPLNNESMLGNISTSSFSDEQKIVCPFCGETHIIKRGLDARGNQRYLCRSCAKTFTRKTDTLLAYSNKSSNVWSKYIVAMLEGKSLAECARYAGVSVQTAFMWRHKIMHSVSKDKFNAQQTGFVELDEMFVNISYKGNHKKSKNFIMPRPACKRGSDNVGIAGDRMCVLFSIARQGCSYARVLGNGNISVDKLHITEDTHIMDDAFVLVDGSSIIKKYLENRNLAHAIIPSYGSKMRRNNKRNGIVLPKAYNIQQVNNAHHRFRAFLYHCNGVSSKYLENYLDFFLWMDNCRRNSIKGNEQLKDTIEQRIMECGTHCKMQTLIDNDPIPKVA